MPKTTNAFVAEVEEQAAVLVEICRARRIGDRVRVSIALQTLAEAMVVDDSPSRLAIVDALKEAGLQVIRPAEREASVVQESLPGISDTEI